MTDIFLMNSLAAEELEQEKMAPWGLYSSKPKQWF
jgi:hypothetical protein